MSKRRLMITGARGFVGRRLVAELCLLHKDAFELVDFVDPVDGARVDLRDGDQVSRAVGAAKPDVIVHLAGIATPRHAQDDPDSAWAVNFGGTKHVADAVLANVPDCRLIFAGSSEAYGSSFNEAKLPIEETAPLTPVTVYGSTKAASDELLQDLGKKGLNSVIFRPFNHTGCGQSADYVVPAFAAQIARIEKGLQAPVIEVGNLAARRDFLDVEDVVRAYIAAAVADEIVPGSTFNVSTGNPVYIHDILDIVVGFSTQAIEVRVSAGLYKENSVEVASGNPEKIHNAFGWAPRCRLEETILKVIDEHRLMV